MRLRFSHLLLILVPIVLWFSHSCSIEKRHFNRGYNLTWKHRIKSHENAVETSEVSDSIIVADKSTSNPSEKEVQEKAEEIALESDSSELVVKRPVDMKPVADSPELYEIENNLKVEDESITTNREKAKRGDGPSFRAVILVLIGILIAVVAAVVIGAEKNLESDKSDTNFAGVVMLVFLLPILFLVALILAIVLMFTN